MYNLYPKQLELLKALHEVEVIVYGGARGGGKSLGSTLLCALDTPEYYSEKEVIDLKIDVIKGKFREILDEKGNKSYIKYLIDYPYYQGVIVRRSKPDLLANTKVECDKVYPQVGGVWVESRDRYEFPSGAYIYLRHCKEEKDLDWFQGPSFARLHIEELTQFTANEVEKMESCVRVEEGQPIKTKYVYTCNPGNRGHAWVYKKYVKPCPPVRDGERKYVETFDYWYQPLKSGEDKIVNIGKVKKRYRYIPALVWDNPSLSSGESEYVVNLLTKSDVLKKMWLDGDWSVKAGDFFDQWDDNIHVIDVYEFYGASDPTSLGNRRRNFDWKGYTLLLSFDYGFRAPGGWAAGFYAIDKETDAILKIEDWLEPDMTSITQARFIKKEMLERYNIDITKEVDYLIGDPQNFWTRKEKGLQLVTFADEYAEEGLFLTKGINDRKSGAKKMWEAHAWQKKKPPIPKLRFLSSAENSIDSFPFLPRDSKDPELVDTHSNDHNYDENRYMISLWMSGLIEEQVEEEVDKRSWRARMERLNSESEGKLDWQVA